LSCLDEGRIRADEWEASCYLRQKCQGALIFPSIGSMSLREVGSTRQSRIMHTVIAIRYFRRLLSRLMPHSITLHIVTSRRLSKGSQKMPDPRLEEPNLELLHSIPQDNVQC
jgi:hypothetical protein